MRLIDSNYISRKRLLYTSVRRKEDAYGELTYHFAFKRRRTDTLHLRRVSTGENRFTQEEYRTLLEQAKGDKALFQHVTGLCLQYLQTQPLIQLEIELEDLCDGNLLTLDRLVIQTATSHTTQKVIRKGDSGELIKQTIENMEKHRLSLLVHFKELTQAISLVMAYDEEKGYRIRTIKTGADEPLNLHSSCKDTLLSVIKENVLEQAPFLPR